MNKKLKVAMGVAGGALFLFVLLSLLYYRSVTAGLPDVEKLGEYDPAQTTKIFSRDGTLIATLFDQNRTPVGFEEIDPMMREAIVAVEDRRFFEHEGVDARGIVRAALGNFTSGEVQQGASTLTMQLARSLFLDNSRTYSRKLRESILAYRIEKALSKEKILELYLNEVYFGSGAYGIDAAASLYFRRNPNELELWQSALLAGLVQAPSAYSPIENREAALKRMEEVLAAMVSTESITELQMEKAVEAAREYEFADNGLALKDGMLKHPYFTTYAVRRLSEHFPENYIRRGGLNVYTTVDLDLQRKAEDSLTQVVTGPGYQMGADTGAVVVLDNDTGEILAMVGGTHWSGQDQYNRAWQARRQPGSSFKMFVYAAALEAGFTPEQEFADTEAVFNYDTPNSWSPSNSDGKFMGAIPMRTGLQFSRNVVAAKVAAHVGPDRIARLAHEMGVKEELPNVISLALGAGEITPLEMARAYSVLPNGGVLRPNQSLLKVTDADGKVLKDFTKEREESVAVLSNSTALTMCEMLKRVVDAGTGTAARVAGTFVAGKTGTTDKFVDAWFVGFTPHHTVGVWVGRDDNKPMGRVYGGTLPARIFQSVAEAGVAAHGGGNELPGVKFGSSNLRTLCWDSTYLALPNCPKTYQDTFSTGVLPTRDCPIHREVKISVLEPEPEGQEFDVEDPKVESPLETGPEMDPRNDPEVVTPRGALIPYKEETVESELKIEVEVEGNYPKADSTPGSEDPSVGEGEIRVIEGYEEPTEPPVESTEVPVQPAESPVNQLEPTESQETDVPIYTNQQVTIPPDPVGQDASEPSSR